MTVLVTVTMVLAGVVWGPPIPRETNADLKAGQRLYARKCQKCHGRDGQGDPRIGKVLKVMPRNLRSDTVQQKSDEQLKRTVMFGKGKMKPIKGLTPKQIESIISYIRTLGTVGSDI